MYPDEINQDQLNTELLKSAKKFGSHYLNLLLSSLPIRT